MVYTSILIFQIKQQQNFYTIFVNIVKVTTSFFFLKQFAISFPKQPTNNYFQQQEFTVNKGRFFSSISYRTDKKIRGS